METPLKTPTTREVQSPTSVSPNERIKNRVLRMDMVEWRNLKWLQTDNFKKMSTEAKEKLKTSIVLNSFAMPFFCWQSPTQTYILDGKHRLDTIKELESEGCSIPDLLPAVFLDCKDEKEAAETVLLYSSIFATVTQDGLKSLMDKFQLDFSVFSKFTDLPKLSYEQFAQKKIDLPGLKGADEAIEEEDEQGDAELSEDEQTQAREVKSCIIEDGDMFRLGKHYLFCGDYRQPERWQEILSMTNKNVIDMLFTDPPYNLAANDIGNRGSTIHADFAVAAGEMTEEEFMLFLRGVMETAISISRDGALHFIWMDWRHAWHMTEAAKVPYGSMIPKQLCVWNKSNAGMGSFYRAKHEICFIFKYGNAAHTSNVGLSDRVRNNVWDYQSGNSYSNPDRVEITHHPTPKTVQMLVDGILDVTHEGDLVADFFGGSGSTLIAADIAKRQCIMSEIMPTYVQHIIERYMRYCIKNNLPIDVEHLNGDLTSADFNPEY